MSFSKSAGAKDEGEGSYQGLIAQVGEMWTNAPGPVKQTLPNLAPVISLMGTNAMACDEADNCAKVLYYLEPENSCTAMEATRIIEPLAANNTSINKEYFIRIMSNKNIECPASLQKEVMKSFRSAANYLLVASCVTGAFQLVMQFVTLWKLGEAIENAEEKIKLTPNQKETVKVLMEGVKGRLPGLDPLLAQLQQPNLPHIKITAISVRLQKLERSITKEIDEVLTEIGRLHKGLSEMVNSVKEIRNVAFGAAVGGGAAGISGFVNVGVLAGIASPALRITAGIISVANVMVSGVAVWKCWKFSDSLAKLGSEIEEVEKLRCEAVKVKAEIVQKTDAILNAIAELTEGEFEAAE